MEVGGKLEDNWVSCVYNGLNQIEKEGRKISIEDFVN